MNIIHIGNFTTGWDGSICDELHISNALEELGHKVVNIQREQWRERLATDEKGIWHPHPTFILLAQWDQFDEDFIPQIRDLYFTAPIVYFCYDYQADGQEWHEQLIKEADLYLSKRIADSKYPNWQWLAQDFAPSFLDAIRHGEPTTMPQIPKDIDVLFTGSYLPWATERNETLKAIDEKFDLVIHSVNEWPGFKNVQPPKMDWELPRLYERARVIISIDHTLEAGYWSDRPAQIMACRGFVLHRYQPLSEARFRDKIVYFYNIEDCLEKISYYLEHDVERINIAREGYDYAHGNLFVYNRVQDLITIVSSIL